MIEFCDVTHVYKNGTEAVHNINLTIEQGEFVFIVGSSGSGKSTLIKMLLKEVTPTTGQIFYDGKDLCQMSKKEIPYLRRQLGVVFQDFRLLPNRTVYDNVAFAMKVIESSSREIRRNVPMVLSMVGLHRKARSYPTQLSGGEQQRTALARAIVNNPPILLADEPTGNLDPDTAWEIMSLLDDIHRRGTTVIIATHAKDIVDAMKKRVVTIADGHIVRDVVGGYGHESGYGNEI